MKTISIIILLLCLSAVHSGSATELITIGGFDGLNPDDSLPGYSVLLAISGGGARGIADIGVLRAFEEKGIQVRAIAGSSMGGVIGGLYAAGYTPDQMTSLILEPRHCQGWSPPVSVDIVRRLYCRAGMAKACG